MLDVLTQFLNTVTSLVQFVINTVTSLINLVAKIPAYVSFLTTSINVLPVIVIPFALASIAIYVVLFMLGR